MPQWRTDLAMEAPGLSEDTGVDMEAFSKEGIDCSRVCVRTREAGDRLGRPQGQYITLLCGALNKADASLRKRAAAALGDAARVLIPESGDVLVIGLGNRRITADALGARVVENMLVTRHILADCSDHESVGSLRGVCAIAPGVLGVTGIETAEMARALTEHVRPSAVVAVDALAARESIRIGTAIQVTDTGILPGSGVGNHRMALTRETLGVPVIAVGVPMVVYASVIARDALRLMAAELRIEEEAHAEAMDVLVERVTQRGMGELVVTPREIDDMVASVAQVVALGLNIALQPRLHCDEIVTMMNG